MIHVGDCQTTLKQIPSGSVNTAVTSPPYWGLRDYGYDSQIGLEETPQEFIDKLVGVFDLVRDCLRDDGTLWVNIGDSYAGPWGAKSKGRTDQSSTLEGGSMLPARQISEAAAPSGSKNTPGIKPKDMVGIPWMLAFALRDAGWYLRQDIIWHKPAPMPSSVSDRCTTAHEYLFLFSKSPRYFYDQHAISEPSVCGNNGSSFTSGKTNFTHKNVGDGERNNLDRRNKRSVWSSNDPYELHRWLLETNPHLLDEFLLSGKSDVWTVNTKGFKGAHFACYPPKLIEPCILAGSPEKRCASCGAPHVRVTEKVRRPTRPGTNSKVNRASDDEGSPYEEQSGSIVGNRDPERHVTAVKTIGFEPSCQCGSESEPGVVLDPFAGSGTTAEVAQNNGRDWIMCEANPEYVRMIEERTKQKVLF